jgi:hypothetical protein
MFKEEIKIKPADLLTNNVPVVYMARDVMILMWANLFRGQLEEVGLENRAFWALKMAPSKASAIWVQKKSRFSGPTPTNGPLNRLAHIKIIMSRVI